MKSQINNLHMIWHEEFQDDYLGHRAERSGDGYKHPADNLQWRAFLYAKRSDEQLVNCLRIKLTTCKNDYFIMTKVLENPSIDDLKDCIQRMKYREPLFKNV